MTDIKAPASYFTTTDGDWFAPTDHCRGPWDVEHCHAGPPTGLLARAMEQALADQGSDHRLVRLTVELPRPIPMSGFRIECHVGRAGRSVTSLAEVLIDGDGNRRISSTGLALRPADPRSLPTAACDTPDLVASHVGAFPIMGSRHGRPAFGRSVEVRYPPGETADPGPTTAWMRSVPLLAGEVSSPFQRICPLADCGNAFSRNAEPSAFGFLNPDLTLVLHRPPEGDWLGASSVSHWQPDGIGMSDALLFDHRGVVGRALQTLLVT